jgi:hypothetical protein
MDQIDYRAVVGSKLEKYFDCPQGKVEYLTHISRKHRAVFVEVPKAGCTVVKRVLQCSENGGQAPKRSTSVHDRSTSPLGRPIRDGFDVDEVFGAHTPYFRFAFVRNPFSRALSCYLEKIVGEQWLRDLRLPKLGLRADQQLDFNEFLRHVECQEPAFMDIHWAPQSYLLSLGKVEYGFLGRFETFQHDLLLLRNHLALDAPDELFAARTQHTTNAREQIRQYFDRESESLVRSIYRDDFEKLAYGTSLEFA